MKPIIIQICCYINVCKKQSYKRSLIDDDEPATAVSLEAQTEIHSPS